MSLLVNTGLQARQGLEVHPGKAGWFVQGSVHVMWDWDSCNKVAPVSSLPCCRGGCGTLLFRWIPREKAERLIQIAQV